MIKFISSWAEQITLAVVIATILELILPNSKNKKYIQMMIGIYVLFNIISPIINNKKILELDQYDLEKYANTTSSNLDQTSMNSRLEKIYLDEMKEDIIKRFKEQGLSVIQCNVDAELNNNKNNSGIHKIEVKIKKVEDVDSQNKIQEIKEKIVTEYEITDDKINIILK